MHVSTRRNMKAPVMGMPMGVADYTTKDFEILDSDGNNVLFGIDPLEAVELTVINEEGTEVNHTFQAGPLPYYIKKILKDETATVVVQYYL